MRRYAGEAFVRDYVGLKPLGAGRWEVYFGSELVGELHENESGSIRMARYARGRDTLSDPLRCGSLRSPPFRGPDEVSAMC